MMVEVHATLNLNFCMMMILWFPIVGHSGHMFFWTIVIGLVSELSVGRPHHPL